MKHVLVTGGAGFVGSSLALRLKKEYPDWKITCLDNLRRRGSELNVDALKAQNIDFCKADVRNRESLLELGKIDLIIDCCAEPSVMAAFDDPAYSVDTNLVGTLNCLQLAQRDKADFVFLSSSRVYPIEPLNNLPFQETQTRLEWTKNASGVSEDFPLAGTRSLYGATKLASELVIQEYAKMFDFNAVINRLGVIAGPGQMGKIDQGIVGFWTAQHMYDGHLSYIGYGGEGKQTRDAVHIDDVGDLIVAQLRQPNAWGDEVFNAGGGARNTFSLQELTEMVSRITGKVLPIEKVEQARRADVRIYYTDNTKVSRVFGWKPQRNLETIIADTQSWIETNYDQLKPIFT